MAHPGWKFRRSRLVIEFLKRDLRRALGPIARDPYSAGE